MEYQVFMIALRNIAAHKGVLEWAQEGGFRKVASVKSEERGWRGICVLDRISSSGKPLRLPDFEKRVEEVQENIPPFFTTSFRWEGKTRATDKALRREWAEWLETAITVSEALSEGEGGPDLKALDTRMRQAVVSASPRVTSASTLAESLREAKKIVSSLAHTDESLLSAIGREHLFSDGVPRVALDALVRAEDSDQEAQVLTLLRRMIAAVEAPSEGPQRLIRLRLLADADPALFFPFCQPEPLAPRDLPKILDALVEALRERFFGREALVQRLATNLVRRLAGDSTVLTPLLHGPPGTGKSFLVMQVAEALGEAGIPADTIFQPMTEGGSWRGDEEVVMQLTGTASHYSNGNCGSLYRSAREMKTRLTLALLDEADKCGQNGFLVSLLDPHLPLTDSFIAGLVGKVDLRPKTVFFLSANDTAPLRRGEEDPLWSRLDPVPLTPYTRSELAALLERKVAEENPFDVGPDAIRTAVRQALARDTGHSSLRRLLDQVSETLFLEATGRSDQEKAAPGSRKIIHFPCRI